MICCFWLCLESGNRVRPLSPVVQEVAFYLIVMGLIAEYIFFAVNIVMSLKKAGSRFIKKGEKKQGYIFYVEEEVEVGQHKNQRLKGRRRPSPLKSFMRVHRREREQHEFKSSIQSLMRSKKKIKFSRNHSEKRKNEIEKEKELFKARSGFEGNFEGDDKLWDSKICQQHPKQVWNFEDFKQLSQRGSGPSRGYNRNRKPSISEKRGGKVKRKGKPKFRRSPLTAGSPVRRQRQSNKSKQFQTIELNYL